MKKATLISIVLMAGSFATPLAQAQGILYLSNLGQTPIRSMAVGSDYWIALEFATGTNAGGYVLNSIQLLMAPASGNPSGFSVSVYSMTAGALPGSSLGSLAGFDPAAGGIFAYDAGGMFLAPHTGYFIVLTAATPVAEGAYSASGPNTFSSISNDGWGGPGFPWYSRDGLGWGRPPGVFQFALYATAVPEPTAAALAGLGLAAWSFRRFRQRK